MLMIVPVKTCGEMTLYVRVNGALVLLEDLLAELHRGKTQRILQARALGLPCKDSTAPSASANTDLPLTRR